MKRPVRVAAIWKQCQRQDVRCGVGADQERLGSGCRVDPSPQGQREAWHWSRAQPLVDVPAPPGRPHATQVWPLVKQAHVFKVCQQDVFCLNCKKSCQKGCSDSALYKSYHLPFQCEAIILKKSMVNPMKIHLIQIREF